jgi:4-amino-4-deoxy-L-arabinose transferase-like glycosyltransferase
MDHSSSFTENRLIDRIITHRLLPVYLCIGAFVVRFVCILVGEYSTCSDAGEFHEIILNLVAGKGFHLNGMPTAYRMPGFPAIMALCGKVSTNMIWLRSVLALFEVATGICVYLLAKRHLGKIAAFAALAVWMVLPISVVQPLLFMSEGLATLLLVALLMAVTGPTTIRTAVIGGLLCGLLILVKQHLLLFPVVYGIILLRRRERLASIIMHLMIFSIVALVVTIPWAIRNKHQFGAYTLSTNGGQNLYIGNNPSATGSYYNLPPDKFPSQGREIESDRVLKKEAIFFIVHNPGSVIRIIPRKIAHLFSLESATAILIHFKGCLPDGVSYREAFRQTPVWLHMLLDVPYAVIALAALWALFLYCKPVFLLEVIAVIVCFWISVHMLYFGASRFHYPLMPLLVLAASAFFSSKPYLVSPLRVASAVVISIGFCGIWGMELFMAYR